MTAVNLSKGNRVNLTKAAPSLANLLVRLNWTPQGRVGAEFDLDTSVFACKLVDDGAGNQVPQVLNNENFIFYNNLTSPDGAIVHSGDDLTGADGEQINVCLAKLNPLIEEISFVVTIHDFVARGQNFGQVPSSSISLLNADTNELIAKYDLGDDFSNETAVQFGSIYKRADGDWAFKAVGTGYAMGLDEFCGGYGIKAEYA